MTTKDHVNDLLQASGNGDLAEVVRLIEGGIAADSSNSIGYTPLMAASRSYRVEVVDELLKRGADVNSSAEDGLSALHCAVGETPSQPERQAQCVKLLLDAGADPEQTTDTGLTPLMNAAWFGCLEAARFLLSHPVDANRKDQQGRSARDLAQTRKHDELVELIDSVVD